MMIQTPLPLASDAEGDMARCMVIWGRLPVYCTFELIPVDRLIATQSEVLESRVEIFESVPCSGPIEVALINGRYVIVDGHHRATAAVRLRRENIFASVRSAFG